MADRIRVRSFIDAARPAPTSPPLTLPRQFPLPHTKIVTLPSFAVPVGATPSPSHPADQAGLHFRGDVRPPPDRLPPTARPPGRAEPRRCRASPPLPS